MSPVSVLLTCVIRPSKKVELAGWSPMDRVLLLVLDDVVNYRANHSFFPAAWSGLQPQEE